MSNMRRGLPMTRSTIEKIFPKLTPAQHGMKEHGKTQEDMTQMQSNLRAAIRRQPGLPE